MTGYGEPTTTDYVSCSWQCHKDRNPPSSEPGTDYGTPYGSNVFAVESGTVSYVKTDNSGAMGRVVEYILDDGRTTRTLHMSAVYVSPGQRVGRADIIGLSGASGYGSDWYYGPHAHQTLWPGASWAAPTIDFALYVGPATDPIPGPSPPYSTEGEAMLILAAQSASSDGLIQNGWTLVDPLSGPICILSRLEWEALDWWSSNGIPYRRAEWSGDQIRSLVAVHGMHPVTDAGLTDYDRIVY